MELDGQVGLFADEPKPEADGTGTIAEDGITLMHGDCLELMPRLPGGGYSPPRQNRRRENEQRSGDR